MMRFSIFIPSFPLASVSVCVSCNCSITCKRLATQSPLVRNNPRVCRYICFFPFLRLISFIKLDSHRIPSTLRFRVVIGRKESRFIQYISN
uniref:Putative secreted peptide n=1 Tax=Anopheles braziliensis TaxID=58242 RepID=A0A2M3ZV43_9DIPT